jgi:NitT/TauT family transport system ATP-binding protein
VIEVQNLTFRYQPGAPPIFEDFSWEVAGGEAWAIIGPSGCGKTTLLYLLVGLLQATAGEVRIAGEVVRRPRPETGVILQDYGLLPWASVWDNAALGLTIRDFYGPDGRHAPREGALSGPEAEARVSHWLERLGIAGQRDKFPGQISGGQRQRTAIARTLALGPDLLLMDEPFSSLDALTREDLQNLTVELRRETGLTTIIVTHNIEEAVFLGKRILALSMPPNRAPRIVENPEAGGEGWRSDAAFLARCDELRAALGVAV